MKHPIFLKYYNSKNLFISTLLCLLFSVSSNQVQAQTIEAVSYKKMNIEFFGQVLAAQPLGVHAKATRMQGNIKVQAKISSNFGFLFDYRVKEKIGIGTGLVYAPLGWWEFIEEENSSETYKKFSTINLMEIPFFTKIYFNKNVRMDVGGGLGFLVISKIKTVRDGEKTTERYGENGTPLPQEIVPNLHWGLSLGKLNGIHFKTTIQYSGTLIQGQDWRNLSLRIGLGGTISR